MSLRAIRLASLLVLIGLDQLSVPTRRPTHSATTVVSIPAGTAAGVYYVLGHVDRDNEVNEIGETNNTAYRKIIVQ
jgi:subtilase family serine protease